MADAWRDGSYVMVRAAEYDGPEQSDRPVVTVDPAVHFGQPAVGGTPTAVVAGMVRAGEDVASVAVDLGLSLHQVLVACWYEGTWGRYTASWWAWVAEVSPALGGHEPLDVHSIAEPPSKATQSDDPLVTGE